MLSWWPPAKACIKWAISDRKDFPMEPNIRALGIFVSNGRLHFTHTAVVLSEYAFPLCGSQQKSLKSGAVVLVMASDWGASEL